MKSILKEKSTENINIRVTSSQKAEILKFCLDNDLTITDMMLLAFSFFRENNPIIEKDN